MEKTIEMALDGDSLPLHLCIERLYLVPRERKIDLPIPALTNIEQAPGCRRRNSERYGSGQGEPGATSRGGRQTAMLGCRR